MGNEAMVIEDLRNKYYRVYIEYKSMQQQGGKNYSINKEQTYSELASLLILFLHSPSADIEHQLTLFHPQLYLQLILNPSQPKEVRQACCASFKSQIINNNYFSEYSSAIIQQIESAYFSLDDKILAGIEGSFEIVTQRLFEMYLDDEKKLNAFASIMQRISNTNDIRNSYNNLRAIKLVFLLIRSMDPTTLNNQICIGELICYLKQVYYQKYQTNDQGSINGRGLQLLQAAMGVTECQPCLNAFLEIQVQIVRLITQIIQKLETEQITGGESIPIQYIRNSDQIDNLLQSILSVSFQGRIYGHNTKVNQFKAIIIQIYIQQYCDPISQPFFILCLSTITKCDVKCLFDHIDTLVAACLQLLQRSTIQQNYGYYFYSNTQILVLKLFQLSSMSQSQSEALENDPEHFVEISDDFCKNQSIECVKIRAGSLLYNLCLTVDGNLTFVTNMALIPLYALQKEFVQKFMPSVKPSQIAINSGKGLPVLLELWSGISPQGLTQTSLLVLSCISDLIIKRNQFNIAIREHLNIMTTLFSFKNQIISAFPPVIISRYIQLFSFFSFEKCLDVFLSYYSVKPVYGETILKALQTVMHFYDKKNQNMKIYITRLSTNILLLSQKLTPLLQKIIISRPELIICIKEKLVQKLVIWLLQFYLEQNIFGCNKISNILCKVLEQYPKFMIQTDHDGFNFDLQALNQYLIPLYKQIITSKYHPAQECIVDIAVSHIECLGLNITGQLLRNFVEMGVIVVEHNEYVLNKCLELFSRTISTPNMERDKEKLEFIKLKNIQVEVAKHLLSKVSKWIMLIQQRDTDQWQILYLLQMCLVTLAGQAPMLQQLNLSKLKQIYSKTNCELVKIKVYMIWMLIVQIYQHQNNDAGYNIQNMSMPQKLPPYQKTNFTIYMISILPYCKNQQFRIHLIRAILRLFFPGERYRKYLNDYESLIHCGVNSSQAEIYAFQTVKSVLHPVNSMAIDPFRQFRVIYQQMSNMQQQRKLLTEKEQKLIREVLGQEMVGSKPRKIYHVKKVK